MLILGKYKDYYDYLVGIYGLDKDIVFDRKDAQPLNECNVMLFMGRGKTIPLSALFDKDNKIYAHKKELVRRYWKHPYIDFSKPIGDIFFFKLEIGYKQYTFQVERSLDEDNNVCLEHKLLKTETITKKSCQSVIGIIVCETSYLSTLREIKKIGANFILSGTWITKYISAEEIYNEIYNYLISIKDKDITDGRTDVQKAESHGFNKESFRNPIRVKDLK